MRQVPAKSILIIGNGRAAKHMGYYLRQLNYSLDFWHYKHEINLSPIKETGPSPSENLLNSKIQQQSPNINSLSVLAEKSDVILLLIKDSALESFLHQYPFLRIPKTIHFSGSLEVLGIANIHPLISFSDEIFTLDFYKQIPFAIFDSDEKTIHDYIPGLTNPSFYIPKSSKALYHGLCVASGNLTVLLWQMVSAEFDKNYHLNSSYLKPYLQSICRNLQSHWSSALTGPIARRDEITLSKNWEALQNTSLQEVFEAHVKIAWPEFSQKYFHLHSHLQEQTQSTSTSLLNDSPLSLDSNNPKNLNYRNDDPKKIGKP